MDLPRLTVLDGRFAIGRVIAAPSAFIKAYLAWDLHDEIQVTLEEYFPAPWAHRAAEGLIVEASDEDLFAFGLDAFLQEAAALREIMHPNVQSVTAYFESQGTGYRVSAHHSGAALAAVLEKQGGPLPYATALGVMRPLLGALQAAHRKGLNHGAVSPAAVFLSKTSGAALLRGFQRSTLALAAQAGVGLAHLGSGAAPEQYANAGHADARTDVYGWAATLLHLSTGRATPPVPQRLSDDSLPALLDSLADVPAAVRALLKEALALEPARRPDSIAALQQRLREALEVPAPSPAVPSEAVSGRDAEEEPSSEREHPAQEAGAEEQRSAEQPLRAAPVEEIVSETPMPGMPEAAAPEAAVPEPAAPEPAVPEAPSAEDTSFEEAREEIEEAPAPAAPTPVWIAPDDDLIFFEQPPESAADTPPAASEFEEDHAAGEEAGSYAAEHAEIDFLSTPEPSAAEAPAEPEEAEGLTPILEDALAEVHAAEQEPAPDPGPAQILAEEEQLETAPPEEEVSLTALDETENREEEPAEAGTEEDSGGALDAKAMLLEKLAAEKKEEPAASGEQEARPRADRPPRRKAFSVLVALALVAVVAAAGAFVLFYGEGSEVAQFAHFKMQGDSLFAHADYAGAKAEYERALAARPRDAYVAQQLGLTEERLVAVGATRYAANLSQGDSLFARADSLRRTGNAMASLALFAEANQHYYEALRYRPDDPDLLEKGRRTAEGMNFALQAGQDPNAALTAPGEEQETPDPLLLRKQLYDTYRAQADALFDKDQLPKAQEKYRLALAQQPSDEHVGLRLAEIEARLEAAGNEARAEEHRERAASLARGGRNAEARFEYERALEIDPEDAAAREGVARADSLLADSRHNEQQYQYHRGQGDALAGKGSYDTALVSYRRALSFKPGDAYIEQQIGKMREAAEEKSRILSTRQVDNGIYKVVDEAPQLRGGLAGLHEQVRYPQAALDAEISGRVYVQFVIDEQGRVQDARVLRGIGGGCDEEALRVIRQARFEPGKIDGVPVKMLHTLFVSFKP